MEFHIIVVLLFENIFVPSKLFQKLEAPSLIKVDKTMNLLKNSV